MSKKLYVGNLSYNANDASLRDIFSQIGPVESATVIIDKMSGRSRGFGFVEMTNDEDASRAIETLNGQDNDGRKLVVNEARPLADRPPRQSFGGGSRGGYSRGGFGGGGRGSRDSY